MKDSTVMKYCSALPVLVLASNLSYAMPGMHGAESSGVTEPPAVSKDMGAPINSPGSEIEITYSADGKTAIFVSTREGSVESSGTPYNFDIWMARNVDGVWQEPVHLGADIDPTVGPNINTSAWELEPSFQMMAMSFISRDMSLVIYCQVTYTSSRK